MVYWSPSYGPTWTAFFSAEICTHLFFFTHTYCVFLASLSPRFSDTTGLWSVSLVVLGFVSRPLLQRGRPPSHTLHPLAAGQCWRPLPRAGGTGWMRTTQLYETPVTHRHRYCQYSTLGLSCYHCWTEKCCWAQSYWGKLAALPVQLVSIWVYTHSVYV